MEGTSFAFSCTSPDKIKAPTGQSAQARGDGLEGSRHVRPAAPRLQHSRRRGGWHWCAGAWPRRFPVRPQLEAKRMQRDREIKGCPSGTASSLGPRAGCARRAQACSEEAEMLLCVQGKGRIPPPAEVSQAAGWPVLRVGLRPDGSGQSESPRKHRPRPVQDGISNGAGGTRPAPLTFQGLWSGLEPPQELLPFHLLILR